MQKLLLLFLISTLAACAQVPISDIEVDSIIDPEADFSAPKSYTWLGTVTVVNDPDGKWVDPDFDAQEYIAAAIDRELLARGWLENDDDAAVIVGFIAGIDMDALSEKIDPDSGMKSLESLPQGGLAVVLLDRQTGLVIWVGSATGKIHQDMDAASRKTRLNYAVSRMFDTLPK